MAEDAIDAIIAALKENGFKTDESDIYRVSKTISRKTGKGEEKGTLKIGVRTAKENEPCCSKKGDIIITTYYKNENGRGYGYQTPFSPSATMQEVLDYVNSDDPLKCPTC